MSICMKMFYFTIKLLKIGFVANVKYREEPGLACCNTNAKVLNEFH